MALDHAAAIRAAIQTLLDAEGDGYVVGQLVISMSLERVNTDGDVSNIPWLWTPSLINAPLKHNPRLRQRQFRLPQRERGMDRCYQRHP